ncbi:Threonylcarbamoyl-AMP synthase [bioreactor metagenome]|uniref:Threonylcarbamoyl-AMP synthase n=1 Tax=bioreactor metagenome TaxID=1076179 RepID=A0A645HS31_9ZZZZ
MCKDEENGISTGVMASEETKGLYSCKTVLPVGNRSDISTVAANLFDTLRRFDELGIKRVYSEVFDESGCGMAVMNRLNKAAGYKCIKV